MGIAGPYGTSFSIKPNTHYIMVAGGYGAAPLGFLAEKFTGLPDVKLILSLARTMINIYYLKKDYLKYPILNYTSPPMMAVKDTRVTGQTYLLPLLSTEQKSLVVTCGPELMEKGIRHLQSK